MTEILLDARANWDPTTTPAYALVPRGGRLVVYSTTVTFADAGTARQTLLGASPDQEVEGYRWALNYTLGPGGGSAVVPDGMTHKSVEGMRLLCTSDECGQKGWHDGTVCSGLFAEPAFEGATVYLVVAEGGTAESEGREQEGEQGIPVPPPLPGAHEPGAHESSEHEAEQENPVPPPLPGEHESGEAEHERREE